MLLMDVSNIMYTGASSRGILYGDSSEFTLNSIPYFMNTIAAHCKEDKDMVAVFEKVEKTPSLAKSTGYKSGRNRNPKIEWEIAALKELLKTYGFPILEVEGVEADHVIANYCRKNKDKQNITILSADMDIASNVYKNKYQTKIVSFSANSYNVDKSNFHAITGVEYNFMNINKILKGCTSDKILAFPNGSTIYNAFINYLYSLWRRRYNYNKAEHTTASLSDEVLSQYNTYEYFRSWYDSSPYYKAELVRELDNRKQLIEGKIFDVPDVPPVNWHSHNDLIEALNLFSTAGIKSERRGKYNEEATDIVINILRNAQLRTTTLFEGTAELEEYTEVDDISNIIGILGREGDL